MTREAQQVELVRSSNRLLVLGPSGSGKTHLSCILGESLGLPVIHLDREFWRAGWIRTPQPQWRDRIASLVQRDRWIMDGTYESTLDMRLPAADAVIVIDRGRWACLGAVVKRTLSNRRQERPDAPAGQPLDLPFLRYIWNYRTRTRPQVYDLIQRCFRTGMLVELHGGAELDQFVAALTDPGTT